MKFALSALTSAAMAGLVASRPSDPTPALLALQAEYAALGPQLNELGLGALGQLGAATGINIDLSGISKLGGTPLPYYSGVDLAALRAAGYTDLADRLENAGNLSVEVAEKGLVALKKIIDSNLSDPALLVEANAAGLEASEAGLAALAEIPTPDSLPPGTIANLRANGLHRVADSLVNAQKGLEGADKAGNFLAALSQLGVGPGAKEGAAKVAAAVAARTPAAAPAAPAVAPVAPAYTGFYSFPQYSGYYAYPYYG